MDNKAHYFSTLMTPQSLKSVFGKQALVLPGYKNLCPDQTVTSTHNFNISKKYLAEWNSLFKTKAPVADVPFMYYWPTKIYFLMNKLLPSLGLNLRNVFHIGHESEILQKNFTPSLLDADCRIKHSLTNINTVKQDKIILLNETIIENKHGQALYKANDYVMVMNMKPEEIMSIHAKSETAKNTLLFMQNGFRYRKPQFPKPQQNEVSYFCDNDLALRFGCVAGAVNVTHGVWLISRAFKRGNPFLQGTCTANLIIMLLSMQRNENIKSFKVYFNNKLFLPGTVTLRFNDQNFELFDPRGTMVSYGSRSIF